MYVTWTLVSETNIATRVYPKAPEIQIKTWGCRKLRNSLYASPHTYYLNNKIKNDEICGAYRMHGTEETCKL